MTVLIHTIPHDTHAAAVQIALSLKNEDSCTWFTGDFPSKQTIGINLTSKGDPSYFIVDEVENISTLSKEFDTVWHRRIGPLQKASKAVDSMDERFVVSETRNYLSSVISLIGHDAFWVNGAAESSYADNKLVQLKIAKKVGFIIPETLATNSIADIKLFLKQNKNYSCIYKPFQARSWTFSDGRELIPYTNKFTENDLPSEELIRACPGIFQVYIEKKTELRVTIMGNHVVTASVDALDRNDWRASSETTGLIVNSYELPEKIRQKCLDLMKELKLVFGCIDLILTPENEYVFLEVNEMGQFLWVEYHEPSIKMLDAFSDFLIERNPEFEWKEKKDSLVYLDILKTQEYKSRIAKIDQHVLNSSFEIIKV